MTVCFLFLLKSVQLEFNCFMWSNFDVEYTVKQFMICIPCMKFGTTFYSEVKFSLINYNVQKQHNINNRF